MLIDHAIVTRADSHVRGRRHTQKTCGQVSAIAAWRERATDDEATAVIRAEAKRLAAGIIDLARELKENKAVLSRLVDELADGIQELPGVGPVTAAIVLTAYSHHGRVHSEAAFAALAGVNPIPASSGHTIRHRLNRHGDRQLNQALDVIARVRMRQDPQTQAYVHRRTQEGKTTREIRRCLKKPSPDRSTGYCRGSWLDSGHRRVKRYVIREVYHLVRAHPATTAVST